MKKNITLVLLTTLSMLYSFHSYSQANKSYSNVETKNVLYYKVEEIVKMTFGGTTTRYTLSNLSLISKVNLGPDNIRIITPIYKDENYSKKSYYVETKNLNESVQKNQESTNLVEIKIDNKNIEIPENPQMDEISLALAIDNLTKQDSRSNIKIKKYPLETDGLKLDIRKKEKLVDFAQVKNNTKKDKIHNSPKTNQFSLVINNLTNRQKGEQVEGMKNSFEVEKIVKKEPVTDFVEVRKDTKKPVLLDSLKLEKKLSPIESSTKEENQSIATVQTESKKENYVSINVTDVYERVAQKGYKSVYMFKEMANGYYFKNEMEKAAKWYKELLTMTSDVEPVCYYRFGIALIKIGETEKGNAMIEKFNRLVE
ncbi:hypothetical protein AAGV28_12265 [Flavobacterium sp. FZUC8N2.13]|uniref:Tetratricopeptide repeat protein n=1 Tax=Flavobacterium zubiriense TaxID=3138075 RepID=A0ABV4TFJ6_9FLAO